MDTGPPGVFRVEESTPVLHEEYGSQFAPPPDPPDPPEVLAAPEVEEVKVLPVQGFPDPESMNDPSLLGH